MTAIFDPHPGLPLGSGQPEPAGVHWLTQMPAPAATAPISPPDFTGTTSPEPLLQVHDLIVEFPIRSGPLGFTKSRISAVDRISFELSAGETLGLVGESGSGKTTVGRAILRLIPATSGHVRFSGRDVMAMTHSQLRLWRRQAQIIFQDPGGSLNPRMRVIEILAEPLRIHGICRSAGDITRRVRELMDRCGLPWSSAGRYPHEFSGGQKQRIAIARALALEPSLIVCDEPTSALDVSIQAQIINLLHDLQTEFGLSYLFISHDMAVIQHVCKRIAVMYRGKIVEEGPREQVLGDPKHDYTKSLLSAVPEPDPRRKKHRVVFAGGAM